MKLQLKYFASLREALGAGGAIDFPPPGGGAATAGALRAWLMAQSPEHARRLDPARAVRVAVDQVLADEDTPLADGAEVAFFPPVTGG